MQQTLKKRLEWIFLFLLSRLPPSCFSLLSFCLFLLFLSSLLFLSLCLTFTTSFAFSFSVFLVGWFHLSYGLVLHRKIPLTLKLAVYKMTQKAFSLKGKKQQFQLKYLKDSIPNFFFIKGKQKLITVIFF